MQQSNICYRFKLSFLKIGLCGLIALVASTKPYSGTEGFFEPILKDHTDLNDSNVALWANIIAAFATIAPLLFYYSSTSSGMSTAYNKIIAPYRTLSPERIALNATPTVTSDSLLVWYDKTTGRYQEPSKVGKVLRLSSILIGSGGAAFAQAAMVYVGGVPSWMKPNPIFISVLVGIFSANFFLSLDKIDNILQLISTWLSRYGQNKEVAHVRLELALIDTLLRKAQSSLELVNSSSAASIVRAQREKLENTIISVAKRGPKAIEKMTYEEINRITTPWQNELRVSISRAIAEQRTPLLQPSTYNAISNPLSIQIAPKEDEPNFYISVPYLYAAQTRVWNGVGHVFSGALLLLAIAVAAAAVSSNFGGVYQTVKLKLVPDWSTAAQVPLLIALAAWGSVGALALNLQDTLAFQAWLKDAIGSGMLRLMGGSIECGVQPPSMSSSEYLNSVDWRRVGLLVAGVLLAALAGTSNVFFTMSALDDFNIPSLFFWFAVASTAAMVTSTKALPSAKLLEKLPGCSRPLAVTYDNDRHRQLVQKNEITIRDLIEYFGNTAGSRTEFNRLCAELNKVINRGPSDEEVEFGTSTTLYERLRRYSEDRHMPAHYATGTTPTAASAAGFMGHRQVRSTAGFARMPEDAQANMFG